MPITDSNGITYVPWSAGTKVGYQLLHPSGAIQYLYFNPSDNDSEGVSNVFVYCGEYADPSIDEALHHYKLEAL